MDAVTAGVKQIERQMRALKAFAAANGVSEAVALRLLMSGVLIAGKISGVDDMLDLAADEGIQGP